eukprot:8005461-Alexandrium_andersonii.AAC.1
MTSASAPPCRCAPIVARQLACAGVLGSGASGTWPSDSSGCKGASGPGALSCSSGPARRTQQMSSPKQ